jgi:hypothetical protein
MTRKLRTLGLALVAILAMSAAVASTASATNDVFEVEKESARLTGEQVFKNKFTLAGQSLECVTSFVATVIFPPVAEIRTVEPIYDLCTYGENFATVKMNGCRYNLTGTTDANGDAQVSIVDCNAGSHIEFELRAIKCVVTVKEKLAANGNQVAAQGVHYTNDGAGTTRGLLIDFTAKLKVSSEPEFGQPEGVTCASLTNSTTTLDGSITVRGEELGTFNHVGLLVK